jgi:hypothetical protein
MHLLDFQDAAGGSSAGLVRSPVIFIATLVVAVIGGVIWGMIKRNNRK